MGAVVFFGARPGISTSETSSTSSTSSTGSSSDNSDGSKGRIAKDTVGVFGHVFDPEVGETAFGRCVVDPHDNIRIV